MRFLLFIAAFLFITNTSFAQGALSGKDLSTIKVDAMTEAEIGQIQQQLKQGGVTIDQVEQQAKAKGMSASEFAKLKARLESSKTGTKSGSPLVKRTQSNKMVYEKDSTRTRPENKINPTRTISILILYFRNVLAKNMLNFILWLQYN